MFIHEFAHFKIANVFQLDNVLRFINVKVFASYRFICVLP